MKKIFESDNLVYWAIPVLIVILTIVYVSKSNTNKPNIIQVVSSPFDGTYNVTCFSQGVSMAVADITVNQSQFEGKIVNTKFQSFNVQGNVLKDGTIQLSNIKASVSSHVKINGKFNQDGTVEGDYAVGPRNGNFFGFRYSDKDIVSSNYDGKYQIEFNREKMKMASGEFDVKNGTFISQVRSITDEVFKVQGNIINDGRLLLTTAIGNKTTGIAASGKVTKDGIVSGIYYIQTGQKGTFKGKRIQ